MINKRKFDFTNAQELILKSKELNMPISEIMLNREMEIFATSKDEIMSKLAHSYNIMKKSVNRPLEERVTTMGNLIGGEAQLMMKYNSPISGSFFKKVIAYSMAVLEQNCSMGIIVAAPTAGSSGVIPGTFLAVQEEYNFNDEVMIEGLLTAGAVGYIVTRNATVSGAEGGCQAEVGSASAMAAAALVHMFGGNVDQLFDAAATSIANILGLVCDPIAGLVESPCQRRNAMGATNAIISADIALSGAKGLIPFDEIISAMYSVGKALPFELRESALGGVAGTKTGCDLSCKIFG